ncbi:MAG: hypothetical protein WKF58_06445 [Ilumatobacteraceae bacterium]
MTPLEIEAVGEAAFVQCFHGVDSTRTHLTASLTASLTAENMQAELGR